MYHSDSCKKKPDHCDSCKKRCEDCCCRQDRNNQKRFCHCCNRYY